MGSPLSESVLIYDGYCPVCSNYVAFIEVRRKILDLRLVSARDDDPVVREAWARGINLNNEMALRLNGKWYAGADVIAKLAELGTPSLGEGLLRGFLGSTAVRKRRYSILVFLRKVLLRILRRPEITPPPNAK
jgi:predicted DCC family thiol-disulfide oxidoreductase YuxK